MGVTCMGAEGFWVARVSEAYKAILSDIINNFLVSGKCIVKANESYTHL